MSMVARIMIMRVTWRKFVMNKIFAIALTTLLVGCGWDSYRAADYQIVCGVETKAAYYVEPGAGATSFLRKSPQFDKLCKDGKTQ